MWWGEWDDDPIHMAESGVTKIIINIKARTTCVQK